VVLLAWFLPENLDQLGNDERRLDTQLAEKRGGCTGTAADLGAYWTPIRARLATRIIFCSLRQSLRSA